MYNNFTRSRTVRFIISSLLILTFVLAVLVVAPTPAEAADGQFYPTTVRCWPGRIDMKVNITGAYQGQYAAVRHQMWLWVPGQGWITNGAPEWEIRKLSGPNTATVGGFMQLPIESSHYFALATEVSYWNGSAWGPVQRLNANHYQHGGFVAQTYCQT